MSQHVLGSQRHNFGVLWSLRSTCLLSHQEVTDHFFALHSRTVGIRQHVCRSTECPPSRIRICNLYLREIALTEFEGDFDWSSVWICARLPRRECEQSQKKIQCPGNLPRI